MPFLYAMTTDTFDLFAIWKNFEVLSPAKREGSPSPVALALTIFFLLLTAGLLLWFFRRFKAGSRSYKDVLIMSGAVFAFLGLNEWAVLYFYRYSRELYIYFDMVLLYETAGVISLFSLAMIVSNLILLIKEGFRLRNLLSLGAGLLQVLGLHAAFALNCMRAKWGGDMIVDALASMLYIFFTSIFFGLAATGFVYTRQRPSLDRDYVLVLGCAVFGERVPPLLAARIDKAIKFARKQEAATGKRPLLVLSGGQRPGEAISEAEAMRRYALEKGIPEEGLLPEDRSANTSENFLFSKRLLEARFCAPKGVFTTTSYHVFRSELLSAQTGLHAAGLSAPTKWYFLPNAFIREITAFLQLYKKHVLLLFVLLLIISVTVALVQWSVIYPGRAFFG